jgi:N6-adenosine-specific RNA methylase IME4
VKIELAAIAGVSHDTIAKVEAIRDRGGPELLGRVCRGDLSVHQGYQILRRQETEAKRDARREENRRLVATAPTIEAALAAGARFTTIIADPPWEYEGDLYGRARPEYATMPLEAICAFLDPRHVADDAHLYLWVTFAFLVAGHRVMDAWGFRPRGLLVWRKPALGIGRYFRRTPEFVLFGVKGSLPLKRQDVETVFDAPQGEQHSAKPEKLYEIVESCSPGPYLELFARRDAHSPVRPDWSYLGAEAPAA